MDRLAGGESHPWVVSSEYVWALKQVAGRGLGLAKPTTYMNDSGSAVINVLRRFNLALQDVLILVDDVHLELGRIRIRRTGSDGGHNGIRSIIEAVGSNDFNRLKIGIGAPLEGTDQIDHVLGAFGEDEVAVIDGAIRTASDAVVCWRLEGVDAAMNRYNTSSNHHNGSQVEA